jgi:hypothetical protein
MRGSSDPPLALLLLGLSYDTSSLPVVWLPIEPLPEFETFAASKGISYVVELNSQRDVYVSCHS